MKKYKWLVPTIYILFLMLPIYWLLNMSFKTTTEISNCLQSFSGIVSDLAADMSAVSLWMQTQAIKELKEINEKKHKKDPLSFDGFVDDDETLVN